jgi:hypothetical protein
MRRCKVQSDKGLSLSVRSCSDDSEIPSIGGFGTRFGGVECRPGGHWPFPEGRCIQRSTEHILVPSARRGGGRRWPPSRDANATCGVVKNFHRRPGGDMSMRGRLCVARASGTVSLTSRGGFSGGMRLTCPSLIARVKRLRGDRRTVLLYEVMAEASLRIRFG